jgi:hypothetical protein
MCIKVERKGFSIVVQTGQRPLLHLLDFFESKVFSLGGNCAGSIQSTPVFLIISYT